MEFNDIWTKEVNDQYRKMIKEKKSTDEIREYFGDKMNYHPKQKFKRGGFLTYEKFLLMINEIKIHPNYIDFGFRFFKSPRFSNGNDIRCYFTINNIDYVLSLEYLIEDNELFHNDIVYNVFFTNKEQFDNYQNILLKLKPEYYEKEFSKLQNIVEKETNKGDVIKIFNALSYILLKMVDDLVNPVLSISETDNPQKINFYKKSIEDSFKDKYELLIGESKFFPGINTYYYIIKN
jgi:hypothetical protein